MTAPSPRDRRTQRLDEALEAIAAKHGPGAAMLMSDGAQADIGVISTGCLGIDLALGVGGVPRGRVTEIFGPESSGKTTLALQLIAQAQRAGGKCAFIDAEHAFDANYAAALGVELSSLVVSQPDCGEQALQVTEELISHDAVDLVVVDSVAALTPRAEIDGEMGDQHVGLHARLMSQALRKLTAAAGRYGTAVVFLNQLRCKIGVTFGSPEVTTGGNALKFYSSVRIDIRKTGTVQRGAEVVGMRGRVKVVKNKLAPPFREAQIEIRFGEGICPWSDLIQHGLTLGSIRRSGARLTFGDERFPNQEALRTHLKSRGVDADRLRADIVAELGRRRSDAAGR